MEKFTVIDIRQELTIAQVAASIVVNKEAIGTGAADNLLFNVAPEDIEKELDSNPNTELIATPLDVIYVCCLEKDSEKIASSLFKLTECTIIATIKVEDWIKYLKKVSTILLGGYLISAISKAQADLQSLPADYLESKYGVKTFDEVAKLLVDSNLSSTYTSMVSRMFPSQASVQSYTPHYSRSNPGGVGVVNLDSQKLKSALGSLISENSRGTYTTEESTVILVANPNMVLVKAHNLFSSIYARDEANGAIKVDSLLAQLFSECEEPSVISSCFSCPKVMGNCYESLAKEHNLTDDSKLLNPFRGYTISASSILSREKSSNKKPALNAFGKQIRTYPAMWDGLQRQIIATDMISDDDIEKVTSNMISSLTSLGFSYVKPSMCIPSDKLINNAFRKVDSIEVDLSESSLESNSLHWRSLAETRKAAYKFRKVHCENCALRNPCLDANKGKINYRCKEFLEDTEGASSRLSCRNTIEEETANGIKLEKSISDVIKRIVSEYGDSGIVYKSIYYLPGSKIYLTNSTSWSGDYVVITDIVHEDILVESKAPFHRLVRNTLDKVEGYIDGKSVGYHFAEGIRNPLNRRAGETLSVENKLIMPRYELSWYTKSSPIGLNNILLPKNKSTSGWLARVSLVRCAGAYGSSVYTSLYVDLDVALASVLTPLSSIGQGRALSDSGYMALHKDDKSITGVDSHTYMSRYFRSDKATQDFACKKGDLTMQYWFLEDGYTADSFLNKSMLDSLSYFKKPFLDKKCLYKYLYITANSGLMGYFDSTSGGFGGSKEATATYNTIVKIYPGTGLVSCSAVENISQLSTSNISELVNCSRLDISHTSDDKVVTKKSDSPASILNQSMSWILRDSTTAWNFGIMHTCMGTVKLTTPATNLVTSILNCCYPKDVRTASERKIRDSLLNKPKPSETNGYCLPVSLDESYMHNLSTTLSVSTGTVDAFKFDTDKCCILLESYRSEKSKRNGSKIKIMHLDLVDGKLKYVPVTPHTTYVDTTAKMFSGSKEVDDLCHKLSSQKYGDIVDETIKHINSITCAEATSTDSISVIRNMLESSVPGNPELAYSVISRAAGNSRAANLAYKKLYKSGKVRVKISAYKFPVCAVIYDEHGNIVDKLLSKPWTSSAASYIPSAKSINIPTSITSKDRGGFYSSYGKFIGGTFMPSMDSVRLNVALSREFIKLAYSRERMLVSDRLSVLNKCVSIISGAQI
jgi:hypothetical protein